MYLHGYIENEEKFRGNHRSHIQSRSLETSRRRRRPLPVTVDGTLEELHGVLRLSELALRGFDLSAYSAHTSVGLEGVCPPLGLLVHHLQDIAAALLRGGELLQAAVGLLLLSLNIQRQSSCDLN